MDKGGSKEVITERLEVQVKDEVDVVVCGGGPAGIGAAVAASRLGAETVLIERYGFLGGMMTAGLVNPLLDVSGKGGIVEEFIARLDGREAITQDNIFDPEAAKFVLDRMTEEGGVRVFFHSWAARPLLAEGRARGAILETKEGRLALKSRVVVDCTGDGDLAARAGVPFTLGRAEDNKVQAASLMFRIGGTTFSREYRKQVGDLMREALARGASYEPVYDNPGYFRIKNTEDGIFNWAHMRGDIDPLSVEDLSELEREGRTQIQEIMDFINEHLEEFEGTRLQQTAPQVGVRESRHIHGDYMLEADDVRAGRQFSDGIVNCRGGFDVHSPDDTGIENDRGRARPYQVPYRSLIPQGIEGMLVAGRCISADHLAASSLRLMGPCMIIGQAAGTAAALALNRDASVRGVESERLVSELRRQEVNI